MEVPDCFYRISIKALVLNDTKDKFLICQEENGKWDLPGGGLDFEATPQDDVAREIQEEMGLSVINVATRPSYFATEKHERSGLWKANVVYEAALEHLNFTPSDECVAIRFVDKDDMADLQVFPSVANIAEQFKPENHR